MDKRDTKNLKKRYLSWLYKTTKEALDKIERKFTQLDIDRFLLKELKKEDKAKKALKLIAEFQAYILNKEIEALGSKYEGKDIKSECYFLEIKLKVIEKAIIKEIGHAGLDKIKDAYEEEMARRILEEKAAKT
ncbi:MAG: hypothetical protein NTU54_02725 [Candidatus Omnitrophica bacterium]|nr:hypothetical protein [Candidatus Omnitrophota bacterium]